MLRRLTCICVALTAASPARATWLEATTPHFIIYSEQSRENLARYADELERFDQGVRPFFDKEDPLLSENGKLKIYVLRNQAAVAALAGRDMAAGFYVPRASGARAFVHREDFNSDYELKSQTVFQHEYLHHLMLANAGEPLPMWVVEGMAELFGTAEVKRDGSLTVGKVPQYRAYDIVQSDLSLDKMLGASQARADSGEILQTYARGWLLMHMLLLSPGREGQLTTYLRLIGNGTPALDSARQAFGDLRKLERDLKAYLRQNRFSMRSISANKIHPGPVRIRTLGPGEAAILPTIMKSERGVDQRSARTVLTAAQRVATRFPADPVVLAALAEAQQDAGNNEAAIEAADTALRADPRMRKAMVMKARAMLALAEKKPAGTDFKAVRQVIGRANRLDPDSAEPLLMFYRSYAVQGIVPTKNAIDGLYYAQALAPQDDDLRMAAVQQLIADDRLPAAAKLFGPIAYNPHSGKLSVKFRAVMVSLQAGNGAQALQQLDALSKAEEGTAKER